MVLVDDHPIVRQGLRLVLEREKGFAVCAEAEDASAALAAVRATQPTVVIVDLRLKGRSGLDLIKDLRSQFPRLRILVLSVYDEAMYCERALRAGADGYVIKQEAAQNIVRALRRVVAGGTFVSESVASRLLARFRHRRRTGRPESPVASLSDRELEILEKLGEGMSVRAIAQTLGLSVNTIETHRAHLKAKLHLSTAAQLNRFAAQWLFTRQQPGA